MSPYCRTRHKLHAENYRIHPSNLGLYWVANSKNRINSLTSKRSNFGKNDLKVLQLGFRFRFKFFDSFEGDCLDCDKNSTSNSIRLISPNIVKPECNISELLIFWFNHVSLTHITSEFSAYTRSWKRWRLHTDC